MAENWTLAFGRYLRELRERRGLSLNEVATLSQAFADNVQKGYLSRVENGRQRLALSKVIALSRIYDVPADVLLERMELDLGLEKIDGPQTEGLSFAELRDAAARAMATGAYWEAYGYLRDACHLAADADVVEPYLNQSEQHRFARVSVATAVIHMGRLNFVHHELSHVEAEGDIRDELRVLVYERLAVVLRNLRRLDEAWAYARRAYELGERSASNRHYLGFAYFGAAAVSRDLGELTRAVSLYQKAHGVFGEQDRSVEVARCLGSLGEIYNGLDNTRAARRTLTAAYKKFSELGMRQSMAVQRIMLGVIEEAAGNVDVAEHYWREAATITRELDNRGLEFKASLYLLKLVDAQGKRATSRALTRRLSQLSNWLPRPSEDLDDFERHLARRESGLRTGNAEAT